MSTEAAPRLSSRLTDDHVAEWYERGYCIVEEFVDPDVVSATVEQMHEHLPTWEQFTHERENWPKAKGLTWLDFPYRQSLLNDLALNPELISFARRALGDDDVVLAHSEVMVKYAPDHGFDQNLHADYGNNQLVVPMHGAHEQTASITYLTDVTIDFGPTHVVSYQDAGPYDGVRTLFRDDAPEVYARETPVTVPAGSIFLYSMRTLHRGSAFTATEGLRHSIHVAYQRRSMSWGGWRSFPKLGDMPWMARLLVRLDPERRSMIGFPPPGDPYWTPESVEAVQRRYPDMDMTPYLGD